MTASGVRWQELPKSECFRLLARERVGRVAFVDDLGPIVMPVNFVLDRHMTVFRTDGGTKRHDRERALAVMFDRYLRYSGTGLPVHTWPVAS